MSMFGIIRRANDLAITYVPDGSIENELGQRLLSYCVRMNSGARRIIDLTVAHLGAKTIL